MPKIDKINILIIGAGKGGVELLNLLRNFEAVNIIGVVDVNENAPGLQLARKMGLPVSNKWESFIEDQRLNEIIDVTGSGAVYDALRKAKPGKVNLMDGAAAKILWALVEESEKEKDEKEEIASQWSKTFDTISDMISIQDTNFRIITANKAFLQKVGMSEKELKGKYCYEVAHCSKTPRSNCPCKKLLETKEPQEEKFYEPHLGIYLSVSTTP
ncbi:MAG: PAS domain-containing protein, partial [Candidatus Omnitrophica bacterium]|nr:PAS domain-containing protein [Candidatus Omnitrophota bacterium]